jgi:hypothetical protein
MTGKAVSYWWGFASASQPVETLGGHMSFACAGRKHRQYSKSKAMNFAYMRVTCLPGVAVHTVVLRSSERRNGRVDVG